MKSNEVCILSRFNEYAWDSESGCAFLYAPCGSPYHQHTDFYEISLITCGSFINEYKGKKDIVDKNCLLFFRIGERHSILSNEPKSTHFSFIMSEKCFESFCDNYLPHQNTLTTNGFIKRQLSDVQGDYLASLANNLLDNTLIKYRQELIDMFMFNSLSLCNTDLSSTLATTSNEKFVEDLISKLNNFHYLDSTVNKIYKDYPIAQSTLISGFKKRTNYTIVQYHGMKKMDYAAQLLAAQQHSVTEISNMINISSLSHFTKKFKQQYGVGPKEYQKSHAHIVFRKEDE